MDEIIIPKRGLLITLSLVAMIALAVWKGPALLSLIDETEFGDQVLASDLMVTPTDEDAAAQAAAVAGARAFYTLDYRQGQQAWLDKLCQVSTQTGCVVYQNVITPNLWPALEEGRTITTVNVRVDDKVSEQTASSRGDAPMQIWRMKIELSAPWPVQREPETAFSALGLVIKEGGVWKFERFLTEEEMQTYQGE
jgi:hypothetical protein